MQPCVRRPQHQTLQLLIEKLKWVHAMGHTWWGIWFPLMQVSMLVGKWAHWLRKIMCRMQCRLRHGREKRSWILSYSRVFFHLSRYSKLFLFQSISLLLTFPACWCLKSPSEWFYLSTFNPVAVNNAEVLFSALRYNRSQSSSSYISQNAQSQHKLNTRWGSHFSHKQVLQNPRGRCNYTLVLWLEWGGLLWFRAGENLQLSHWRSERHQALISHYWQPHGHT